MQVRTGRLDTRGRIRFATKSNNGYRDRATQGYHGQADRFGVWVPAFGELYLVPVGECGRSEPVLRLTPAAHRTQHGCRYAAGYQVSRP